jgi:hypothetical protein
MRYVHVVYPRPLHSIVVPSTEFVAETQISRALLTSMYIKKIPKRNIRARKTLKAFKKDCGPAA